MGRVTKKRLSEVKGDSFVAARILSSGEKLSLPSGKKGKGQMPRGGLPFSKGAGFCWIYNDVLCSYQISGSEGYIDRCENCSRHIRAEHDEEEEDEATMREIDEAFRRMHAGMEQE